MSGTKRLGVVLAGGGTGGHIQPNLAIAEELARLLPNDVRATFVVSDRAIDRRVLEAEHIEGLEAAPIVSPAKPLIVRPIGMLRFLWNWGGAVRTGRSAIRELRASCDAVVVLGTGGFVTPQVMVAARAEGVPRVLVNLDAKPGKANRLSLRWATSALTSAPVDEAGYERVPPIVRARMRDLPTKEAAREKLGLLSDRQTLLVTGGSQGAASVNRFVLRALQVLRDEMDLSVWQVLHQCGEGAEEECRQAYAKMGVTATVRAYIERMDLALAASDCAVARGGAGAIADVWATKTPALVMPYPFHRDAHQKLNARELAEAGGVILATDRVDPIANVRENRAHLRSLMNPQTRRDMSVALEGLGPASCAEASARAILALAGISSPDS